MTCISREYSITVNQHFCQIRERRLNFDGCRCRRQLATDIGDGTNKLDADGSKRQRRAAAAATEYDRATSRRPSHVPMRYWQRAVELKSAARVLRVAAGTTGSPPAEIS